LSVPKLSVSMARFAWCGDLGALRHGAAFAAALAFGAALATALAVAPAQAEMSAPAPRVAMIVPVAAPQSPQIETPQACDPRANVLGTSRTIVVDPAEHRLIGTMQYGETLPLKDHEVVLTFDDGPLPPSTRHVLDTLEAQCVKATFFIVGRMARAYPQVLRDIAARGHTIGTHSENHPFGFSRLSAERAAGEIDDGIAATRAALGDGARIAPFFRIPGLSRSAIAESAIESRGLMIWSADFPADDWRHISAAEVHKRAMRRLKAKGKGILLLHDIQPATAKALPGLLAELKAQGFRIVHVIAADADHPKTITTAAEWRMGAGAAPLAQFWPTPPERFAAGRAGLPAPAARALGIIDDAGAVLAIAPRGVELSREVFGAPDLAHIDLAPHAEAENALPVPAMPALGAWASRTAPNAASALAPAKRGRVLRGRVALSPAAAGLRGRRARRAAREHRAEIPLFGQWSGAGLRPSAN